MWKNGKKEGHGLMVWKNKDRYFGNWANNLMNGEGAYFYANGSKYCGNWNTIKRMVKV